MDLGVHATWGRGSRGGGRGSYNRMTIDVAALEEEEEAATACCSGVLQLRHADSADDDLVGVAGRQEAGGGEVACGMWQAGRQAGGTLLATLHWRILTVLY